MNFEYVWPETGWTQAQICELWALQNKKLLDFYKDFLVCFSILAN